MTTSQMWGTVGMIAASVSAIVPKLIPLSDIMPPAVARWLPVVGIIAGAVVAWRNQSASLNHKSIPVEEANALVANAPKAAEAYAPSLVKQVGGNAGQ